MLSKVCMYIYVYYDMLVCKVEAEEKKNTFSHSEQDTEQKIRENAFYIINFFQEICISFKI